MESGKFDDAFIIIQHLLPDITRGFYLIVTDPKSGPPNNADFLNPTVAFEAKSLLQQTTEKIRSGERTQPDRSQHKEIEEHVRDLIAQLGKACRTMEKTVDAHARKRRRHFLFRIFAFSSVVLVLGAGFHYVSVYMEKSHLNGDFAEWVGENPTASANATGTVLTGPKGWVFVHVNRNPKN